MITSIGGLTFSSLLFFPIAVLLWPLILLNYHERRIGSKPDEWFWADRLLLEFGWVVC